MTAVLQELVHIVRQAGNFNANFPWSRWFNNDLWNLLPASSDVNLAKGDKLPSALARPPISTRPCCTSGRA